jgi:hypothetical protein
MPSWSGIGLDLGLKAGIRHLDGGLQQFGQGVGIGMRSAAAQGQFGEDLGHDDAAGQIARGVAAHPVGQHREAEIRALRTGHGDGVFLAVAPTLRLGRGDVVMGWKGSVGIRAALLGSGPQVKPGPQSATKRSVVLPMRMLSPSISSSVDRTGMPLRRTMLDLLPWPRKKRFCSAS